MKKKDHDLEEIAEFLDINAEEIKRLKLLLKEVLKNSEILVDACNDIVNDWKNIKDPSTNNMHRLVKAKSQMYFNNQKIKKEVE